MFSVVIPTLQIPDMRPLLNMYCSHHLVDEVIIVNNATQPLRASHPRLRVLNQERNIYVNPAWNLGAEEARSNFLVLSNDDILFSGRVIDLAARALHLPVGVVGPHESCFHRQVDGRMWISPTYLRTTGFGTLMFLRRDHYVPIPDDLRVWCGDDWLFTRQARTNVHLRGARIETRMSSTAGSLEFDTIKGADGDTYLSRYRDGGYSHRHRLGFLFQRTIGRIHRRHVGRSASRDHPGT